VRQSEPKYTLPLGGPPKDLCKIAQAEWVRVTDLMAATGVATAIDSSVLAVYCRTWAECVRLRAVTLKRGFSYEAEECREIVKLLAVAEDRLCKLAQQFGFTPASRARVQVNDAKSTNEDKGAKFFKPRIASG
jgi:P27 family predicted phage terminase small subunit